MVRTLSPLRGPRRSQFRRIRHGSRFGGSPRGGEFFLDHRLIAHTILMLRKWGEDDLAMGYTNAVIAHDPSAAGAIAAGWM